MKLYKLITFIILSCISFVKCDISKSDIENDQSFIRIFHDNDLYNDYHPLDVAELNDGFLILSTKIKDTAQTTDNYRYHLPHIVKTDIEGNVEWSFEGDFPYISPVPNILEVSNGYYFFALSYDLEPTLFQINMQAENIERISTGNFGSGTFALHSMVDREGNVLLLTNSNRGTKNVELHKIWGIPNNIQIETIADIENSANNGTIVTIPTIIEHLSQSYNNKQYPFRIKEYSKNNNLDSYLISCFGEKDLLSLYNIRRDGSVHERWITGSGNKSYISSFQQLNDSLVAIIKNDNNRISIKTDLLLNENVSYDIDDLTETTSFIELDGNTLTPSKIFTSGDNEYLIYAIATKGEQVALFVYNMEDFALHNIYYVGSTNDISPVTIKQTTDGKLLLLCRTLVTNKYSRIALYKIPFKEIGI